ncbi:MAG: DNA topoisomerase VI subunit B [Planctomycetes bacterium]|nr:DNA topoisomerase VI subunit B [Planctomycetota bacterium]
METAAAQLDLVFPPVSRPPEEQDLSKRTTAKPKPTTKAPPAQGGNARRGASAETLAKQQREISVSEFFAKNRHLLGFDNKRKALLTTVKEAVDNSLDACEDGGILPEIEVTVKQTDQDRFRVTIHDNGPGIVKSQIPNVFGKLLYGSKFHRLKMSRGQQGIGISAAGMYGLITTGKPVRIISRTGKRATAHMYHLAIDTKKNRPDIIKEETVEVDWHHGTEVVIELVASYNKGRQSIDEYLELTAIANAHARFIYHPPIGKTVIIERSTQTLPEETKEIQPHPYGIELGTFIKMLKETHAKKLGAFLATEFSRVSDAVAKKVCGQAGLTTATWVNGIDPPTAERIYNVLQDTKLKAPSTNCLAPIGAEAILAGLLKGIKAEFYTASTRPPSVYRGNPFQIEVGLAYGGQLGSDHRDDGSANGKTDKTDKTQARIIRFANRVPLLYQQSSCCTHKAVVDTNWGNYGLSQSSGAPPRAPIVILIHMASVWVPFISEGKEAIADYDEIRKEVRLALAECGRRLGILLRRKRKKAAHAKRRDVFTRYIDEVVEAARAITVINKDEFRKALVARSRVHTEQADVEFDDHGKVIKPKTVRNDLGLSDTVVVEQNQEPPDPLALFDVGEAVGQVVKAGRKKTHMTARGKMTRQSKRGVRR